MWLLVRTGRSVEPVAAGCVSGWCWALNWPAVWAFMPGDRVTLLAPSGEVTPAGVVPRLKQMTVLGTFDSGHFEYDSSLVLMHWQDAARIFRLEGPTGVRLKLRDLQQARSVASELSRSLTR